MKVTFLGTSSGAPTRHRNVTSLALQLPQQSALWLFDCGEGTQHQIMRSTLKSSHLERIFITHLHGDHLFGLPGLLASRSLQVGSLAPVTLYGPPGLNEYLRRTLEISQMRLGYPWEVKTIGPGIVHEDAFFQVSCAAVSHRIPAFAYSVVERDQPGRFDVEMAKDLGIPAGPLYGRLKSGERVTLPDGSQVDGAALTGKVRKGRKLVFSGDTTFSRSLVELAQDADLLIHEATYMEEDRGLADRASHATARMAAQTALSAEVRTLILTHFSARYESEGGSRLENILREAQQLFPNTLLARDFFSYEIERLEPASSIEE